MISRREFLATAAAAIAGALTAGIVEVEKPVPVEDIQAVPLVDRCPAGAYYECPDYCPVVPGSARCWMGGMWEEIPDDVRVTLENWTGEHMGVMFGSIVDGFDT